MYSDIQTNKFKIFWYKRLTTVFEIRYKQGRILFAENIYSSPEEVGNRSRQTEIEELYAVKNRLRDVRVFFRLAHSKDDGYNGEAITSVLPSSHS